MPEAPVLRCANLTKSFAGVRVLKDVSLDVAGGETVCIAGENGAGKSTLMNLIGGVYQPDSGEMQVDGEVFAPGNPLDARGRGIAFVHQELNLFPNLSIAENILLTEYPTRSVLGLRLLDTRQARRRVQPLLERVGLNRPVDIPVEQLSQGDRQLVEIAIALDTSARLIILDEPTTSLTAPEVDRLFRIIGDLRDQGTAVLYISHTLEHVLSLAHRIVVLRDGSVVAEGTADQFTVESLIRAMVGRTVEQFFPERLTPPVESAPVLEVRGVSEPGVAENVCLQVHAGEVVGIAGLMGSGRSELARMIFGLDSVSRGQVLLDGETITRLTPRARIERGLAYLTESRRDDGLFLEASIEENLTIVHPQARSACDAMLGELHVVCRDHRTQPVVELSGGNQQKIALAKWLLRTPRVLILDEPTRGIDVGAKQDIYKLIRKLATEGMALLVISSEVEELIGLCDRILVMRQGQIQRELPAGVSREEVLEAAV